jgi:hypothetical protein
VLQQVIGQRSEHVPSHAAINSVIRAFKRPQNKGPEQSPPTVTDDSALQLRKVKAS